MKKFLLIVAVYVVGLYLALWAITETIIAGHNEQVMRLLASLIKRIKEFDKQS